MNKTPLITIKLSTLHLFITPLLLLTISCTSEDNNRPNLIDAKTHQHDTSPSDSDGSQLKDILEDIRGDGLTTTNDTDIPEPIGNETIESSFNDWLITQDLDELSTCRETCGAYGWECQSYEFVIGEGPAKNYYDNVIRIEGCDHEAELKHHGRLLTKAQCYCRVP